MTRARDAGWWTRAFRRSYLEAYAHRSDEAGEREAAFVALRLGLATGALLLDAGCGAGRHARALARRGARVVGVDLSEDLLRAAAARGGARFVLGDVRRLPLRDAAFAHAVSLFTSFGYFDDAGDRAHLAEIRRALRAGGTFLLDFLNAPRVAATLVPESERRSADNLFRERRRIRAGRVEKDVEASDARGRVVDSWTESVRLYDRADVEGLLEAAGFTVVRVEGDLAGAPWSESAERLVVTAAAA